MHGVPAVGLVRSATAGDSARACEGRAWTPRNPAPTLARVKEIPIPMRTMVQVPR